MDVPEMIAYPPYGPNGQVERIFPPGAPETPSVS